MKLRFMILVFGGTVFSGCAGDAGTHESHHQSERGVLIFAIQCSVSGLGSFYLSSPAGKADIQPALVEFLYDLSEVREESDFVEIRIFSSARKHFPQIEELVTYEDFQAMRNDPKIIGYIWEFPEVRVEFGPQEITIGGSIVTSFADRNDWVNRVARVVAERIEIRFSSDFHFG